MDDIRFLFDEAVDFYNRLPFGDWQQFLTQARANEDRYTLGTGMIYGAEIAMAENKPWTSRHDAIETAFYYGYAFGMSYNYLAMANLSELPPGMADHVEPAIIHCEVEMSGRIRDMRAEGLPVPSIEAVTGALQGMEAFKLAPEFLYKDLAGLFGRKGLGVRMPGLKSARL